MIATALAIGSRVICGATVRWHCDPHAVCRRIYFGNHSSHLDFIVIWSSLPADLRRSTRPVAGQDYWERTRLRRYLAGHVFHAVLIDRATPGSNGANAGGRAAVERMSAGMSDGHSLIVFPEGTRSRDNAIGDFKSGLFHLSRLRPDAELIPVLLENLQRILPKGETLPVPMLSRVVFGPPLTTRIDEEKHEFLARARDALIRLKENSDEPLD
jgi:1-acyl-sn-glycerol-3-phosphate acyltransferase